MVIPPNHLFVRGKHEGAKDNHSRGEWSGAFAVAKLEAPAQKAYLSFYAVIPPPRGIRPGRDKANDQSACVRGRVRLCYPFWDVIAIRRIHPANASPVLRQSVLLLSEVARALGVFVGRAHVQVEVKFLVNLLKSPKG